MVNLMARERSTLEPLWDGLAPRSLRGEQPCRNFIAYLQILVQPGTWTGQLELLALGRFLERPILVLREDRPPLLFGAEPPTSMRRGIAIWLHHEHFERILETVPPHIWASARAVDPQHPARFPETLGYTPPHISHRGGAHPTLPRGGCDSTTTQPAALANDSAIPATIPRTHEAPGDRAHPPQHPVFQQQGNIGRSASYPGDGTNRQTRNTDPQGEVRKLVRYARPLRAWNPGEGNCLFHAIEQAWDGFGNLLPQEQLRKDVCAFMRQHPGRVLPAWDHKAPAADPQECDSFHTHLTCISQPGAWAGATELVALGLMYPAHPILVLCPESTPVAFGDRTQPLPAAEARINLWLQGGHYEFIQEAIPDWIWDTVWGDASNPTTTTLPGGPLVEHVPSEAQEPRAPGTASRPDQQRGARQPPLVGFAGKVSATQEAATVFYGSWSQALQAQEAILAQCTTSNST